MAKHNKKRNVGLLHEQLVRHASEMTVEGNQEKTAEAVDILMKHYSKNSELLKEFRLFGRVHISIYTRQRVAPAGDGSNSKMTVSCFKN